MKPFGSTLRPAQTLIIGKAIFRPPMRNKYRNTPVEVDGIRFASKAEAKRWGELNLLHRAGEIDALTRQKPFVLEVEGRNICTYIADFVYREHGQWVAEDVKGAPETDAFKIKAKLFRALYPEYELRIIKT